MILKNYSLTRACHSIAIPIELSMEWSCLITMQSLGHLKALILPKSFRHLLLTSCSLQRLSFYYAWPWNTSFDRFLADVPSRVSRISPAHKAVLWGVWGIGYHLSRHRSSLNEIFLFFNPGSFQNIDVIFLRSECINKFEVIQLCVAVKVNSSDDRQK